MTALEPSEEDVRAWVARAADALVAAWDGAGRAPASGVCAAAWERAAALSLPIGEAPLVGGFERALGVVCEAATLSLNTIAPGYLAYVPGGGIPSAALAGFIADGLNRFTGIAGAAPAFARLEADVLVWLAKELGYGKGAGGVFVSGGSMANFVAVVAARQAAFGDGGVPGQATCYASSEAHRSVVKAARLAGVPRRGIRLVAADADLRLAPGALAAAIDADRAAGRRPFMVVASAGTTNTGAVDPLAALATVCRERDVWLHVDGAYGGAFVLCAEGRRRLAGIAQADSVTIDPHKGLFLPYGLGCLVARRGETLTRAFSEQADYLQDLDGGPEGGVVSPCDQGPELSRAFRGLRLWLPLMMHGAGAFREALADKLTLARAAHGRLVAAGFEIPTAPELSIVAFRAPRRGAEPVTTWNARNLALLAAVNARQRVHLSSTTLPGVGGERVVTLRICIMSFRTHAEHVAACVDDIVSCWSELPI